MQITWKKERHASHRAYVCNSLLLFAMYFFSFEWLLSFLPLWVFILIEKNGWVWRSHGISATLSLQVVLERIHPIYEANPKLARNRRQWPLIGHSEYSYLKSIIGRWQQWSKKTLSLHHCKWHMISERFYVSKSMSSWHARTTQLRAFHNQRNPVCSYFGFSIETRFVFPTRNMRNWGVNEILSLFLPHNASLRCLSYHHLPIELQSMPNRRLCNIRSPYKTFSQLRFETESWTFNETIFWSNFGA